VIARTVRELAVDQPVERASTLANVRADGAATALLVALVLASVWPAARAARVDVVQARCAE
jgi:hypothetical protein